MKRMPNVGETVCWTRFGGEWVCGTYVGIAPGEANYGDCFVAVDAPNGRVHVLLSALTY